LIGDSRDVLTRGPGPRVAASAAPRARA